MFKIDLGEFIDEGWNSQQKYAESSKTWGPFDYASREERYQMIINHLGHLIEEVVEARREVVRRPWKVNELGCLDSKERLDTFVEEMVDVLLFFRSTLAYAGVTGEHFTNIALSKLNYNSQRKDHTTNANN